MAKNTLKQKIREKLENEKKLENLQIQPWECDFLARVNGGGPINLIAPLQQVR